MGSPRSELDDEWDEFVGRSSSPVIFQTRAWAEIIRTLGQEPIPVRITGPDGKTKCVLLGVLRRSNWIVRKLRLQRILVEWGPVSAKDPEAEFEALTRLTQHARATHAVEVLLITDSLSVEVARKASFQEIDADLNSQAIVDLPRNKAVLWDNLDSRCRQAIRRAEERGVKVSHGNLDDFFKLYVRTRSRLRAATKPYGFFRRLNDLLVPRGQASFVSATVGGETVASVLVLKNSGYAWYFEGASDERYWDTRANHLLHWQIMQNLITEGHQRYNLMLCPSADRVGSSRYGLYTFKSQFGARIEPVKFFVKVPALRRPLRAAAYGTYDFLSKMRRNISPPDLS